jgi:hypothetical protein
MLLALHPVDLSMLPDLKIMHSCDPAACALCMPPIPIITTVLQSSARSPTDGLLLLLRGDGFEAFRCDRNVTLGIQLANFSKLLKCAGAAMRQQHFI